tara:strand:+ start:709 stop:1140 length:432 start_codon:yes stop_codon:yes gene_type:complete
LVVSSLLLRRRRRFKKSRQTSSSSSFQTFLDSTIESRERKKTVENDEKEEFEQRRGEGRGRGRWSGANTIEGERERERERRRVAACFENNDDYKERNRFLTVSFFFFSLDFSKKKEQEVKKTGEVKRLYTVRFDFHQVITNKI